MTAGRGDGATDPGPGGGLLPGGVRWVAARLWLWVPLVSLVVRLQTAGHGVVTVDEPTWLARSQGYFTALTHGHLGGATVPIATPKTRPGVTTMWIGSAARGLTLAAHRVGWYDGITTPFERSPLGLRAAQVLTAVACSFLIGLIAVLVGRVSGRSAGMLAGGILAIEPFVVGHTVVLHTDGILALSLVAAGLALVHALRLGVDDDPLADPRVRWLAAAGALAGLALLTKVSAVLYLPGFAAPAAAFAIRRSRAGGGVPWRALARAAAVGAGALVGTAIALWPALWVDPARQVQALVDSARLGEAGHPTFFRGHTTTDPGPLYYLYAIPLRATPLVLLGSVAGLATLLGRGRRAVVAVVAALPLPYLLAISLSTKQFDRYALPVLVTMAVLAAQAIATAIAWAAARAGPRLRHWPPLGTLALLVAIVALVTVLVERPATTAAPYPLAYFDPLAGGSDRAERTLLVGWGEGLEQAGKAITADRQGACDGVVTAVPAIHNYLSFPCGVIIPLRARVYRNLSDVTYAVDAISEDQRDTKTHRDYFALVRRQGTLIRTVRIEGLVYARVYRIDHPPPGACADDRRAVPVAPRCA